MKDDLFMFEDDQLSIRVDSDCKSEKIYRVKKKIDWYEIHKKLKRSAIWYEFSYGQDEKKYIKQVELLLDLEDEYKRVEIGVLKNPVYSDLSQTQLRSYVAWRTKVRKGIFQPTEETYMRLYASEVINNFGIGVNDGFKMLFSLLNLAKCSTNNSYLPADLVQWIKDYYLVYSPNMTIGEVAFISHTEYNFPAFVPDKINLLQFDKIVLFSSFDYRESRYWSKENEAFVKKCFLETMANLGPLMRIYNISILDIYYGEYCGAYNYHVFSNSIYLGTKQLPKELILNDYEMYMDNVGDGHCSKGLLYIHGDSESEIFSLFFGAVIKEIELVFRKLTKKSALKSEIHKTADIFNEKRSQYKKIDVLMRDPLFTQIIHETVEDNYAGNGEKARKTVYETLKNMEHEPYVTFRKLRQFTQNRYYFGGVREYLYYAEAAKKLKVSYTGVAPYERSSRPYYDMTNEQMFTYFGFRTAFESSNMYCVPFAYIVLYCSELINNLRYSSKYKTIEKLIDLLFLYEDNDSHTAKYVSYWIKDYYAYSGFECSFYEIIKKYGLERFYPQISIKGDVRAELLIYNCISGYNILKSKVYTDENIELIKECFSYIIPEIQDKIEKMGDDFYRLSCGRKTTNYQRATFDMIWIEPANCPNGRIIVSAFDEYYSIGNYFRVHSELDRKYKTPRNFVGYIIKEMDSMIRKILGFKHKLSADYNKLLPKKFQDSNGFYHFVEDGKLKEAVDGAVVEYFKKYQNDIYRRSKLYESEPVVVKVDTEKLQQIREEAEETKEKLIVDEEQELIENIKPEKEEKAALAKCDADDPWLGLKSSLSDSEKTAIGILLGKNATPIGEFAKSKNLLLEVLVEGINEKAIEFIGDNLIDSVQNTPVIYDDYIDELKEAWERFLQKN